MAAKKDGANKLGTVAGFLVLGMIGGAFGVGFAKGSGILAPVAPLLDALDWRDLFVLPLLWLAAVAVHEAGHLAAGMARGMRFLMLVVGFIGLVKVGGRLRLRTYFNLGALGGFAVALPDPQRELRPQMTALVVGGPLASLLLALVAVACVPLLPDRFAAWTLLTAAISALLFVMTAVPMRAGGFLSDGMQFLKILREPDFLQRRASLIALMGCGLAGMRPRDLDPQLLDRAQAATGAEAVYDIATWLYSYQHALDRGEIDAAGAWLARIEPRFLEYPDGFRQAIAVEFALFEALHRRRADAADGWLAKARGGVVDASRRALAQAALAELRGDHAEVARQLEAATKALPRALDPGLAVMSADQIAAMRAGGAVSGDGVRA